MSLSPELLEAADRLWSAAAERVPCAPVRDLVHEDDVQAAYAVAAWNVERRLNAGARRVGRKIGLTSDAVQRQLGVATPDFGTLLDDMALPSGGLVPPRALLQPKVEAEVAFVLSRDLDGPLESIDEVRAAVGGVMAALEIVDSRIGGWDIHYVDTVADNASSGMFVVSDRVVPLEDVEPAAVRMSLELNGGAASTGSGTDCLGDPLEAVRWLARAVKDMGEPLRSGEVVLSGALGPMVGVSPGDSVVADMTGLGQVSIRFAEEADE